MIRINVIKIILVGVLTVETNELNLLLLSEILTGYSRRSGKVKIDFFGINWLLFEWDNVFSQSIVKVTSKKVIAIVISSNSLKYLVIMGIIISYFTGSQVILSQLMFARVSIMISEKHMVIGNSD